MGGKAGAGAGGVPCVPPAAAASVGVCAASATASLALAMLNKALLSSYDFRGYFALLACQMAFSWAVCVVSRDWLGNPFRVPAYRPASACAGAWMGVLYVLNVVVGMVGLRLVNVPLFFAIRRLTPALIIAMDWVLFRKAADGGTQLAVALSVAGTLVAAWETLSSDGLGYAIALFNNAVTAGLLLAQKRFQEIEAQRAERDAAASVALASSSEASQSVVPPSIGAGAVAVSVTPLPPPPPPPASASGTFGVLYYNAMLAAPLAAALCVASGELGYIAGFAHLRDPGFVGGFAVSSAMGIVLTYTAVLATTYAGPLAVGMTGNVKDVLTTAIGALWFGGFVATAMSVGGLGLSFAGAFLFGAVALQRSRRAAAAKTAAAAAVGSTGVDGPLSDARVAITDGGSWPGHTLRRTAAANAAAAGGGGGGASPAVGASTGSSAISAWGRGRAGGDSAGS